MGRFGAVPALLAVAIAALVTCFAGTAAASPGALRVLIVEAQCSAAKPANTLRTALLEKPGVASVEFLDGATAVPTTSELLSDDVVVAIGDCGWMNAEATGNALADYQDRGGVVVGVSFSWETVAAEPQEWDLAGRWATGGYAPFLSGDSLAGSATFVSSGPDPLLEGVGSLSTANRDELSLAPGATELGEWSGGTPAIAVKGNALGINSYLGDYTAGGTGDYAQLIVNAATLLGPKTLTATRSGTGSGTVTSSPPGISCGAACAATFPNGTAVTLTATPAEGSEFAGWSGAGCTGSGTCTVSVTAAASVDARFEPSPTAGPTGSSPEPPVLCVVPKLRGKTVKAARSLLKAAHCRLGRVTPPKHRGGKVLKQWPAPLSTRPAATAVSVKLKVPHRPRKH